MKNLILVLLAFIFLLFGCKAAEDKMTFQHISQKEAKDMMDSKELIILDVREQNEYDSGHIPNAVLLSINNINEDNAKEVIPHKDCIVLVYCRSGKRSQKASSTLADLGYTNVYDFGGISTWEYDVEY